MISEIPVPESLHELNDVGKGQDIGDLRERIGHYLHWYGCSGQEDHREVDRHTNCFGDPDRWGQARDDESQRKHAHHANNREEDYRTHDTFETQSERDTSEKKHKRDSQECYERISRCQVQGYTPYDAR